MPSIVVTSTCSARPVRRIAVKARARLLRSGSRSGGGRDAHRLIVHVWGAPAMTQALEGVRVLDFTQVEMGPVCTQVLGDFGADVVKVERRDSGDISRGKPLPAEDESPVFLSPNRNKRGLAVHLKHPASQAIILRRSH